VEHQKADWRLHKKSCVVPNDGAVPSQQQQQQQEGRVQLTYLPPDSHTAIPAFVPLARFNSMLERADFVPIAVAVDIDGPVWVYRDTIPPRCPRLAELDNQYVHVRRAHCFVVENSHSVRQTYNILYDFARDRLCAGLLSVQRRRRVPIAWSARRTAAIHGGRSLSAARFRVVRAGRVRRGVGRRGTAPLVARRLRGVCAAARARRSTRRHDDPARRLQGIDDGADASRHSLIDNEELDIAFLKKF
jgi:hypothetical protein